MVTCLIPTGGLVWGWIENKAVTVLKVASLVGVLVMVAIVQFGSRPVPRCGYPPADRS